MLRDTFDAASRAIARILSSATTPVAMQFAALPYRIRDDGTPEVMLLTSRETRRWVIPKGWPMKRLPPPRVAEREAYEEAGLIGTIVNDGPIGSYQYDKRTGDAKKRCRVWVYLLRVQHQLNDWPEKAQRETRWFDPAEAANLVTEPDLGGLIRKATFIGHDKRGRGASPEEHQFAVRRQEPS